MFKFKRPALSLQALALSIVLSSSPIALAKTRQGDALLARAEVEVAKETTPAVDAGYQLAVEALETDRSEIEYKLAMNRLRSLCAQYHVYDGQVARDKGQLAAAVVEFRKAVALDPAYILASQELARIQKMISSPDSAPLNHPLSRQLQQDEERNSRATQVPKLKTGLTQPLPVIKVNQNGGSEVFLTLGKEAGVRVLFDSEYQNRSLGLNQTLDLQGLSFEQALDYVAMVSKSFWFALAPDTIFVANDDQAHRVAYEEQITRAFYLTNSQDAQEVSDIATTIQKVTDLKKLFVHPAEGVIVARGDADRISLAEKIVADLDKPKAEIIIDVLILSVSKDWTRNLGVNFGVDGLTAKFTPGAALNPVAGTASILLNKLPNVNASDFAMSLPGATLSALLSTSGTRILDKAELRMVEGQRSSLKIGTKVPYATGSYQPSASGGGVNTQFQYFDVGLNMDIVAKVHEPDEVSLHIESDASSVNGSVDLGNGVSQPVIAQRKRVADVRVKEGEINFWDIVTQRQEVRSSSGVPGLSQLPGMGRFFRTDQTTKTEEQVVTLLTPHIIRAPDIRSVNLLSVPSGSDQVVRMRYSGTEQAAPPKDPNTPARTIELAPGTAPVISVPVPVPPPAGAVPAAAAATASPFGGGAPAAP